MENRGKSLAGDADQGEPKPARALPGKYLTFRLAGEEYGLAILKVKEIMGLMNITRVPRLPECIRGVINLRGKVIPVMDLRARFRMPQVPDTAETCIVVVDVAREDSTVMMGVVVDSVSEVLNIAGADIEEAPSFGASVNTDFLLGIAKSRERVVLLMDIDEVVALDGLRPAELIAVQSVA